MKLSIRDLSDLLAAQVRCELEAGHAERMAADYSDRQGDFSAVINAYRSEAEQLRRAATVIARIRAEQPSSPRRAKRRTRSSSLPAGQVDHSPAATAAGSL